EPVELAQLLLGVRANLVADLEVAALDLETHRPDTLSHVRPIRHPRAVGRLLDAHRRRWVRPGAAAPNSASVQIEGGPRRGPPSRARSSGFAFSRAFLY